jgi:RNA polymerase sigma-54 factor
MQKLGLSQSLQQKLSPQQIQFIKLLQVPTAELESRIEEELEINPALEEGEDDQPEDKTQEEQQEEQGEEIEAKAEEEVDLKEYLGDDDYSSYKTQNDNSGDEEENEMPIPMTTSLHEQLMSQLGYLGLNEHQYAIGKQLVGSIEADGYIRRELEAIVNDMAFSQGIDTTVEEVESILKKIQSFDPAGIAARNLQECLLLQLERMDNGHDIDVAVAKKIIEECFEEFTKSTTRKFRRNSARRMKSSFGMPWS